MRKFPWLAGIGVLGIIVGIFSIAWLLYETELVGRSLFMGIFGGLTVGFSLLAAILVHDWCKRR